MFILKSDQSTTQHRKTDLQCKVRQAVFFLLLAIIFFFFFFFTSTLVQVYNVREKRQHCPPLCRYKSIYHWTKYCDSNIWGNNSDNRTQSRVKTAAHRRRGASSLSPPPQRLKHRINVARHPREEMSVAPWWCGAERLGRSCWWTQQIQSYNLTAKATFIHFSVVQHNRNFTIISTVNINR